MIRKLLIVAASALVLTVISLSLAWVAGGPQLVEHIQKHGGITIDLDDDGSNPRVTRSFTFDPAQPLKIDAPIDLHFTRADTPAMDVRGSQQLMKSLSWDGGKLSIRGHHHGGQGGLAITMRGPEMPALELNGPGNIEIEQIKQPALKITMAGPGNVEVSGKVDSLLLDASGAGNLDLEELVATDAKVTIAGLGNVDLSVTGTLDANISGAGNVSLHRKPKVIRSQISGIGSINNSY